MRPAYKGLEYLDQFKFSKLQLAFCVDVTASMSKYIEQVCETIKSMIESVSFSKFIQKEFAFVGYRDHPPQDNTFVTKISDFKDGAATVKFIEKQIRAKGGGDIPEAVLDGLYDSAKKLTWLDNSVKVVVHVADAPPHGKEFFTGNDHFPEGCPNGITLGMVSEAFEEKDIKYLLLDCWEGQLKTSPLRKMVKLFRDNEYFECLERIQLKKGFHMLDAVSEFVFEMYQEEKEKFRKQIQMDLALG